VPDLMHSVTWRNMHLTVSRILICSRDFTLSSLDISQSKENIKYSRLMSMDFNLKDLRVNPSQKRVLDLEHAIAIKVLRRVMLSTEQSSINYSRKWNIKGRFS